MKFIGRGEKRVDQILRCIYKSGFVHRQYPIHLTIPPHTWSDMSTDHRKHRFDFMVQPSLENESQKIFIEVNYMHGTKADRKWKNVYKPVIEKYVRKPHFVVIDHTECETLLSEDDKYRQDSWKDWIDVIRALDKAGVPVQ